MSTTPLFKVPDGSRLTLEGRSWLVVGKEADGYYVEGSDDGECLVLSFARVDQAIREGRCMIVKPKDDEKRKALLDQTGGFEFFEQLADKQKELVRFRLPIVLAILQMEEEGFNLTHQAMSKHSVSGAEGPIRKALRKRAREISQGTDAPETTRGGKVKASFVWPQGKTLRRYADLFVKFDRNPVVLADRDHRKGPCQKVGDGWLSETQEQFISYVINLWLDNRKPKVAPLVALAMTQFHVPASAIAQNFCFPSITTIRTRIKGLPEGVKTIGRKGKRQAANLMGAGSTDIRALMFGEKVEMDQHYLSIFTDGAGLVQVCEVDPNTASDELADNEIARIWLHYMEDIATRLPLAWVVAKSADADHSHALLRMATRDKTKEKVRYGCQRDPAPPAGLLLTSADNGTATRNGSVYASQLGINAMVMTSRTYHATDKPYVESGFGPIQWQVLNHYAGYAGSRPGELEGYDPKQAAELTHDEIYGIITRYMIDERPFRSHGGTGMFRATPWQKFEEVKENYGEIEAPDPMARCMHLGVKREASTTPDGVKVFNLPFNSTALQRFADGQSKRVTVHLDPDFPQEVYITAEGTTEVMKATLSMTAFNDLNLEEILDLIDAVVKDNPKLRELHAQHFSEALERRARESGFFPDSRAPSSYRKIEHLQKLADRHSQVAIRPAMRAGMTAPPGSIMNRSGNAPAFQVGRSEGSPGGATQPNPIAPKSTTFTPIKDSKL